MVFEPFASLFAALEGNASMGSSTLRRAKMQPDYDEAIAMFLAAAAKYENPDVFLSALSAAARARGIADITKKIGLGRTSRYKALAPGTNPSYLPRKGKSSSRSCGICLALH